MKKIIILLSLIFISFTSTDPFCDGWEDGYCQGWEYVKGEFAICPVTPICPIPGLNDHGYRDGYNRGFLRGRKDAQK